MRPSTAVFLLSISLLSCDALAVRDSHGLQVSHYQERGLLDGKPDDTKPDADTTGTDTTKTDTATTTTTDTTTTTTPTGTSTETTPTGTPTGTPTKTETPPPDNTKSTPTGTPPADNTSQTQGTPPPADNSLTPGGSQTPTGTDTVTQTLSGSNTSPSPSATSDQNNTETPEDSPTVGTGTIVGLSIAGGVALIGIVGFFVWKFTRKRMADFDDNEAIKWPELNAHGGGTNDFPLPTNRTNQAGYADSEVDLSRTPSNSTGYGRADPYAVPPLPHMNPNQPYQDDPGSAYYDPYQGPVPHTLETQQTGAWPGEAIAMNQMRTGSPAPPMGYDAYGRASPAPMMGRASPAPPMAMYPADNMSRTRSPAPHAAYQQ